MRSLSVALLSWEYPPVVFGGLSRHVHGLAQGLAGAGHGVTVYTASHPEAPSSEVRDGVRVIRAPRYDPSIPFEDLIPWVLALNVGLIHQAGLDIRRHPPDVIHAHDWLVAYAASALSDLAEVPRVATVHATEHGRHRGRLAGPVQRLIHGVERRLVREATRVITCSAHMRREVTRVLGVPRAKVETIPNQVPLLRGQPPPVAEIRRNLSLDGRPLLVYAGRLEYEKGVGTLLEALPRIDRAAPGVRLVVAGTGTHRRELEATARRLRLGKRVLFRGFVDEASLRDLYAAADVVVVPSLYEPFGLVALEAMSSGAPVAAADTGGLRELVVHGRNGVRFRPGDAASLAAAVVGVLTDPRLARRLSEGGLRTIARRGSWTEVADHTADVYRAAIDSPPVAAVASAGKGGTP